MIALFQITERDMDNMRSTPVEPGDYAVITWHSRKTLRAERAEDLEKVGYLDYA